MSAFRNSKRAFRALPLGRRLSVLRERKNLKLTDAAKQLHIAKGHLLDLEVGRSANPTLKTLLAICDVYDITIQELTAGLRPDR